jgi:uncharacterized protein Veg
MIKSNLTISAVKSQIEGFIGKPIVVQLNLGRNKFVTYGATLSGVYGSLFTVLPDDRNFLGKTSFSYAEILCGRVNVQEKQKA